MISGISIIQGKKYSDDLSASLAPAAVESVANFHRSMPMYQKTPLIPLPALAAKIGVQNIFVKDESYRFGLNAFKGLGATYAVAKIISRVVNFAGSYPDFSILTANTIRQKVSDLVFVTATDGNHGKAVAWAAAIFGCQARVYMPQGSQECRAEAIRHINNTQVEITSLNYDDTVRLAAAYAQEQGYYLVQDTGFAGYEEVPNHIVQGYTTMAAEAVGQLSTQPTHVFLQAGVGSMAGGVLGYLTHCYRNNPPCTIIVEPATVACIYESVKADQGVPQGIGGNPQTIMAGLNCGEPNPFTWPILRDHAGFFASCPDWVTEYGMKIMAHPDGDDGKIISGESGAVGLGLLVALCQKAQLRDYKQQLNLNENSTILIFNTEGNTDPAAYERIVNGSIKGDG